MLIDYFAKNLYFELSFCSKCENQFYNILSLYFRTHSVKELEAFAENAVAVNRLILRHMSISEVHAPPPSFRIGSVSEENLSPHMNYDSDDSKSSFDIDLEQPMMMLGLSPPGTSSLARRRAVPSG